MSNTKLTTKDKNMTVFKDLTIKDTIRIMNAGNKFLDTHRGVWTPDADQAILREKMYRAMDLSASLLIVCLSKYYCEFANTLNDVPEASVKARLKRDFAIAHKTAADER